MKKQWATAKALHLSLKLEVMKLHRGVGIHSKTWIEGLGKRSKESMQVDQRVGDTVEGQHASCPVQVHPYPAWVGGQNGEVGPFFVMPGWEVVFKAVQAPWLITDSKDTIHPSTPSLCSSNALVCCSHIRPIPGPLYLPVAASRQSLQAQHLWGAVEPLWVIWVWLFLLAPNKSCVPFEQGNVSVCCVYIQCKTAGILKRQKKQFQCLKRQIV